MATILFPTDFSDAATRAFIYALRLADKLEARIITLHAFDKPNISSLPHVPKALEDFHNSIDLVEFENYRTAIPALTAVQEDCGLLHVEVSHTIFEGDAQTVILERAKAENADFIVMGTTGARGLKELVLGSVAGEVLENAPCPVLAIPVQAVFDGKIDTIAFTTSFREEEVAGLQTVQEKFAVFNPHIHVVNVDLAHTDEFTAQMDQFSARFEDRDHLSFHSLDGTDIQPVLTQFFQEHNIDLVAMVTHKRTFFEELFHYSKTKAMSYHSHVPVLSLPTV